MRAWLIATTATVLAALSLGLVAAPASALDTSTTTVTDDAMGVVITGGTFTFTATVTGPDATPTGTITWHVTDPGSHPVSCSTATTLNNGQATCTITDVLGGTYSATADYSGDDTYDPGSGQDSTAHVATASSSTIVTDNASGATAGGTFTFTATVTATPDIIPTGTVAWAVSNPHGQNVVCGDSTLVNGVGTCAVTGAIAGTYTATATYEGDTNYSGSANTDPGAAVDETNSTTSIGHSPTGVKTGGAFTFTATVSGSAGTPTGSVVWSVTDPESNLVGCSSGTTALDTNGKSTCVMNNVIAGTYSVTATYSGDADYESSVGHDSAQIGKAASTTTLTHTSPGVTGGSFTYTATVTGPGITPTGAVQWAVTDPNGHIVPCPSSLNGGTSTCTVTNAVAGTYSALASYSGDANYTVSSHSDSTASVGKASPAVVTHVIDTSTNATWTNTELTNAVARDSATVSAPGATATGTVSYAFFGNGTCTAPGTTIGTPSLDGSGSVPDSTQTSPLPAGSYSYLATYSGDGNYNSGAGACEPFTVARNAAPTPPTITNIPIDGTEVFGGTFNPTVSTVSDGAPSTRSSTPGVCVVANSLVTFVGVGTCTLTAHTAGTPNFGASDGAPQSFNIGRATPSNPIITNIPASATEFSGFVATVSATGDGATSVSSISTDVCSVGADRHTVHFGGFGVCTLVASVAQGTNYLAATGSTQSFPVGPAARGYWLVGSDGGIFSFGAAGFYGSMGSTPLQRPVVGITPSASRTGYWLVASDGGIFSFGSSTFYGSIPQVGLHPAGSGLPHSLNAPIVTMVPSVTGHGYFMVASDGGVFAFGDAHFAGSCPGIGGCVGQAVSVMPDSTGMGYWLVTNLGAVYAFGDATFYGASTPSSVSVVNAAATPDWHGYWLLFSNGVVDGFGDASTMGAPVGYVNTFNPATAIFPTADGKGYWVVAARGDVFCYGNAPYLGGMAAAGLNGNIIAAFGF